MKSMMAVSLALAALASVQAASEKRPLDVRVTGENFGWTIRYAAGDGRLDTADDVVTRRHLRLPAHAAVRIDLRSQDYVYSFSLPDLDVRDLAVPGRPFRLEFETDAAGTSRLMGDQMCGFTHPELLGDLIVMPPEAFHTWLAQRAGEESARNQPAASGNGHGGRLAEGRD